MDITEHRIPQEGRVSLSVSDRQIDLRLATLPSIYGETVVMRLLDKSASIRTLPELGFLPDTLERYAEAYHHPYGVILVTGPTGAGQDHHPVRHPERGDLPGEVGGDGGGPCRVPDRRDHPGPDQPEGRVWPSPPPCKSILRADPDIVLIGEIRDADTATIAMEAALSGHLVLTTLHTNTASATPLRLTEMGIEPFLVTSAVGSVLTQRLARVLCDATAKSPTTPPRRTSSPPATRRPTSKALTSPLSIGPSAVGPAATRDTLVAMVLAEVMNMTEEIDRMIIEQETIVEHRTSWPCEQGMRTLRQDGLVKAVEGCTTLEEVLRVVV